MNWSRRELFTASLESLLLTIKPWSRSFRSGRIHFLCLFLCFLPVSDNISEAGTMDRNHRDTKYRGSSARVFFFAFNTISLPFYAVITSIRYPIITPAHTVRSMVNTCARSSQIEALCLNVNKSQTRSLHKARVYLPIPRILDWEYNMCNFLRRRLSCPGQG